MASYLFKWKHMWKVGGLYWHSSEPNANLVEYLKKLTKNQSPDSLEIFIPLCGKSLDMKFLYDKGYSVIGVEAVAQGIEEFFQDHGIAYDKTFVDVVDGGANLYVSKDGRLKIYCCDLFKFSVKFSGKQVAVWDRGSLVAIEKDLRSQYVDLMKSLLSPGARYLCETVEFDEKERGQDRPPHPITFEEMKSTFQPYRVEQLNTVNFGPDGNLSWCGQSCYLICWDDHKRIGGRRDYDRRSAERKNPQPTLPQFNDN